MLSIRQSQMDALGPPQPCPFEECIKHKNAVNLERAEASKATQINQKNYPNGKDTCALASSRSVISEATDRSGECLVNPTTPSMEEMIIIGTASGAYVPCNGTTDISKVLDQAGVDATKTRHPTMDQIADSVDDGRGVIVGYDTRPVWGGRWEQEPNPARHAVRVTGVQRNSDGSISGFNINDSGDGVAKFVPAETFQEALDGSTTFFDWRNVSTMVVTDQRIHDPIVC